MSLITIKFGEGLFCRGSEDPQMNLVGFLLADDVSTYGASNRMTWLLLPGDDDTSSNMTFMEKENGYVTLGFLWDKDPYERALTVPIPVMIDLLQQWDTVCKTKPHEVTVYYENGQFRVESA